MGHSRRKPYTSYICYYSNKKDKRVANKRFRIRSRHLLKYNPDNLPYSLREVSNVYNFSSDGLPFYVGNADFTKSEDPIDKEFFRRLIAK